MIYQVDGTTRVVQLSGGHVSVQMPDATVVTISDRFGVSPSRVHLFRRAEYVDVERGTDG